jgi:hypothetical protein
MSSKLYLTLFKKITELVLINIDPHVKQLLHIKFIQMVFNIFLEFLSEFLNSILIKYVQLVVLTLYFIIYL